MKINELPKKKDECVGYIVVNNFNQKAKIINIDHFDTKNVFFTLNYLTEDGQETSCYKVVSKTNIAAGKFKKTIDYSIYDDEEWVIGRNTDNLYSVSSKGRIKNNKTDIEICGYVNNYGYIQLDIDNIPFNYKHVFVYYSFNLNEEVDYSDFAIDHIDRVKVNCELSNLRRVSHLDNSYNKNTTVVAKIENIETGEIFITDRLEEFCRINNINNSLLYKTFAKERNHTNGYRMIDKQLKYGDDNKLEQ